MSGYKAFLTMWTHPKKTIRQVISTNPDSKLLVLSVIYGLPMMFYYAQSSSMGQSFGLLTIFIMSLIGACIIGYLGINLGAFLLFITGKWIGGKGRFKEIRASVAYSNVTNLVSVLIWLFLAAMFRKGVFLADFPYASTLGGFSGLMNTIYVIQLVVAVWSFVIFVASLSEAQGFSTIKAVINTFLPLGVIFASLWLLGLILSLVSR